MRRNPGVYVKGRGRHVDRATITLNGWHRVVMNTEGQSRAMRDGNETRPVAGCACCGLYFLMGVTMTETGAGTLSIRACRLEDIQSVLELWRQADATPGVTDTADDLRRAVADSPAEPGASRRWRRRTTPGP